MTVAELIERLKVLPQTSKVVLEQDYGYHVLEAVDIRPRLDGTTDVVLSG